MLRWQCENDRIALPCYIQYTIISVAVNDGNKQNNTLFPRNMCRVLGMDDECAHVSSAIDNFGIHDFKARGVAKLQPQKRDELAHVMPHEHTKRKDGEAFHNPSNVSSSKL